MIASLRTRSRRIILAGLTVLAAALGTTLAEEIKPETKPPLALPFFLKGIDLNQPTQAAFSTWPSKEVEERPYWLPWSGMTFQRASLFNQPVFLVVTVPWSRAAQSMAENALADRTVLRALNHDYVSVLVSADRRPDIYARYGTGNWPAISLLLADGSPMLSQANEKGVALPITIGPVGVKEVMFNLTEGKKYFEKWHSVLSGASQIYEKRMDLEETKSGVVDAKAADAVVRWLLGNADAKNGGFGAAPKYVLPGLMEWAALREDEGRLGLLDAARRTLKKMAASPLFDTKDGGFHRMAAAPDWGAIQYEKLLGANAEMMRDLVFALREEDDPALRAALASTARFLTSTLARPGGGFYLGQMADAASPDGGGYWTGTEGSKAPPLDKLLLSGPNAQAGAAMLRAGALLDDPSLKASGRAALDWVLDKAVGQGRGATHVIEPEPDPGRYLGTQTEVALGLLDGYEATGDARYLAGAKDVVTFVRNNMKVASETAYRDHLAIGREFGLLDMPLRPMVDNARLARVCVRLAAQGVMEDGRTEATQVLGNYAGDLASFGVRAIEPSLAIDEALFEPLVVTIEGKPGDAASDAMRRAALDLRRAWVVIKTGRGEAAAATLSWHGATKRVTDPAAMEPAMKSLLEASAGAS